jgi:hypothetical protein
MRNFVRSLAVTLIVVGTAGTAAAKEAGWKEFKSDEFGFKMMIPEKMEMKAGAFGDWGGFHGVLGPVNLYGLARKDHHPDVKLMQAFAIKHTGIPALAWKMIHEGKDANGWTWFKTYRAMAKGKFVYAVLGHGPKGAYILVLTTTPANRIIFDKAYKRWYGSVTLF